MVYRQFRGETWIGIASIAQIPVAITMGLLSSEVGWSEMAVAVDKNKRCVEPVGVVWH
jgi:hypothetical protein